MAGIVQAQTPRSSGVSDDMSDKVAVESIALVDGPATFTKSDPYLITAYVFVMRFLIAGNDHHFLLALGILGEPVSELRLR